MFILYAAQGAFGILGDSTMSALFTCEDPATWRNVHDNYWDVVEAKVKSKKMGKLLNLDKW